ncbi:hypothetical protein B4134_1364 [Bacillus safensis]|nr:hypothetical protein B4134_1364 [Bacillus safensis]
MPSPIFSKYKTLPYFIILDRRNTKMKGKREPVVTRLSFKFVILLFVLDHE